MAKIIDKSNLVNDHADYLLGFALTKISDRDLAKDLIQDTFVSALQHADSFKGESSVKTWLTSILNRKIIDHWRKAETRYTDPVSHFFKTEDDASEGYWIMEKAPKGNLADFEEDLFKSEKHQELNDCIDTLPDKWKGILTSKYFEEEKTELICKDFEVTPSNLWVIIHRAKLVLRDCLESKWI